jgi:hypothetical protein
MRAGAWHLRPAPCTSLQFNSRKVELRTSIIPYSISALPRPLASGAIYPDATVARKCHGERLFFCSHHYIFLIGACLSTITILICHSNAACHARTVHRSSSQTYLQFFMSIYSSISYLLFLQSPDAPKKYMLVLL